MAHDSPAARLADDDLDRALVTRAVAGDRDAFGELVERHHGRILALLERLSGCADQACDLAQETFVAAFRHLAAFRHDSRFSTWLHAIACNRAATAARSRRPVVAADAVAASGWREPAAGLPDVSARMEHAELASRVRAALGRLDDRGREVVVLADMQGESYEQIAAALDIPIGTVRSRLHRARLQLRHLLAHDKP